MRHAKTIEPEQDQRRCPRQRVSWLVTVAAGARQYQGRTKDVSASGAKILLKERPPLGTEVGLCFRPPGRRPVETRALVPPLHGLDALAQEPIQLGIAGLAPDTPEDGLRAGRESRVVAPEGREGFGLGHRPDTALPSARRQERRPADGGVSADTAATTTR